MEPICLTLEIRQLGGGILARKATMRQRFGCSRHTRNQSGFPALISQTLAWAINSRKDMQTVDPAKFFSVFHVVLRHLCLSVCLDWIETWESSQCTEGFSVILSLPTAPLLEPRLYLFLIVNLLSLLQLSPLWRRLLSIQQSPGFILTLINVFKR